MAGFPGALTRWPPALFTPLCLCRLNPAGPQRRNGAGRLKNRKKLAANQREVRESFPIRFHSRNSRLTCPTLLIQGKSEAEQLG